MIFFELSPLANISLSISSLSLSYNHLFAL
nr:MAG TPA: hypothetical protein [Caudoviricetes sp.]